jgi:hypothetical protein
MKIFIHRLSEVYIPWRKEKDRKEKEAKEASRKKLAEAKAMPSAEARADSPQMDGTVIDSHKTEDASVDQPMSPSVNEEQANKGDDSAGSSSTKQKAKKPPASPGVTPSPTAPTEPQSLVDEEEHPTSNRKALKRKALKPSHTTDL